MSDRRDPTRSGRLRSHGRDLVSRKVFELNRHMRVSIEEDDVPGLRGSNRLEMFSERDDQKLARGEMLVGRIIAAVMLNPPHWLQDEVIERAVWLGVRQASQELRSSTPIDASDVIGLHGVSVANEVTGIAGETLRRIMRLLFAALQRGDLPEILMRDIRVVLEKITRYRLNLLVNTAVVRAVNAGKLLTYEMNGVRQVGVDPEWLPYSATRQRDSVAGHHHHPRSAVAILMDARSRKAKVRERKARNKAKRERAKSPEEKILAEALGAVLPGAEELIEALAIVAEAEEEAKLVNVLTAGDDKVCVDCEDIAADGPYQLSEARDLIPAHPNCRCAFIPWGDKRFAPIVEQEEAEEEEFE